MTCPGTVALARLIADRLVIVNDEASVEQLRVSGDRYLAQFRDDWHLWADMNADGFDIDQTLANVDAALDRNCQEVGG